MDLVCIRHFRVSFGCLTENQWRASPMVAAKQQFLLVHCAVVVCSDDDIGTHAGKRKMAAVLPALCDRNDADSDPLFACSHERKHHDEPKPTRSAEPSAGSEAQSAAGRWSE